MKNNLLPGPLRMCRATVGSHLRQCILFFLVVFFSFINANGQSKMYWSEDPTGTVNDKIQSANLDGSSIATVFDNADGLSTPAAIFVDVTNNRIYWAQNATGAFKICRGNLDGSGTITTVISLAKSVYGVSVDVANNMLYWSEQVGSGRIMRISMDNTFPLDIASATTIATSAGSTIFPKQIFLHFGERKVYWYEQNAPDSRIYRKNMDGTGSTETIVTNISTTEDFAIDSINGYIYWGDRAPNNKLYRVSTTSTFPVNATTATVVHSTLAVNVRGIAVNNFTNEVYWTHTGTSSAVKKASLSTIPIASETTLISGASTNPADIGFYYPPPSISVQPLDKAGCSGSPATFTVTASNAYAYKWQESSGSDWTTITNGGVYSGATGATLSISNPTGLSGKMYRVVVIGSTDVVSNAATLTVTEAPGTPTANAATNLNLNSTATGASFTASWTAVSGAAHYRLDVSTNNTFASFVPGYNNLQVNGTSQTVSGLSKGLTYYYRVRARSSAPCNINSTNSSTISVVTPSSRNFTVTNGSDGSLNYQQTTPTLPANNHPVGQFAINANAGGGVITQIAVTLSGTYSGLQGTTPFRLYASNANDFINSARVGNAAAASNGEVIFSSLSDVPSYNTPRYYWLTVDLSTSAGGTIKGSISNTSFTVGATSISGVFGEMHAGANVALGSGSVLPVSVLNFTAARQTNNTAFLQWQTDAEVDNRYFTVERSSDGLHFEAVGKVNPVGGSGIKSYSFIDAKPLSGTNYYRLKQTDLDGAEHYHGIRIVKMSGSLTGVSIYPNPTLSATNLSLTVASPQKVQYRLVNTAGVCVQQKSVLLSGGTQVLPLDLSKLPQGLYNLMVSGEGIEENLQIIKQ